MPASNTWSRVRALHAADVGADPHASRRQERAALWVFVVVALAAFVLWMALGRHEWFTTDEWAFLAGRTAFDLGDLFRDHATHWSTVPILVYRGLWWTFGIRTYMPYLGLLVALHLTVAALLRIVMRRAGVNGWIATAAAGAFALFGSGYQNIVWAFQIGFVGSLVFGLVHLLLADHDGPINRRDLVGVVAGLASIISAGVGVTMVGTTALAVLLRRGPRAALLHGGPLGVVYVSWWAVVVRGEEHPGVDTSNVRLGDVVDFVRIGVTRSFTSLGQVRGFGLVLAALLVVGLAMSWSKLDRGARRRQAVPLAMIVGAVGFLFLSGYGRAGLLGAEFAEASRYQHVVAALLLPGIAVALDALARAWRPLVPIACALLLVGVPGNVDALRDYTRRHEASARAFRLELISIPEHPAAREVPRRLRPFPRVFEEEITVGWLLDGVASGRIPHSRPLSPAGTGRARFRLSFMQRPGAESDARNCRPIGDGVERHFDKGDAVFFRGDGAMTVASTPGSGYPQIDIPFRSEEGSRLVAVLGPIDVMLRQASPYLVVTVCDVKT